MVITTKMGALSHKDMNDKRNIEEKTEGKQSVKIANTNFNLI
jgi:hypothetical protein